MAGDDPALNSLRRRNPQDAVGTGDRCGNQPKTSTKERLAMRSLPALLLASLSLTLGLAAPAHADGPVGCPPGSTAAACTTGNGHGDGGMWWPP